MITTAHLNWFKLKVPYQANSPDYKAAYAKLHNASYADLEKFRAEFEDYDDLEKFRAEFEDYDDRSLKVKQHCICGEWFATTGYPLTIVNMKDISTHRQKYRVQKRIAGQLYRWTFNSLSEALAKRDAIFGLVATK